MTMIMIIIIIIIIVITTILITTIILILMTTTTIITTTTTTTTTTTILVIIKICFLAHDELGTYRKSTDHVGVANPLCCFKSQVHVQQSLLNAVGLYSTHLVFLVMHHRCICAAVSFCGKTSCSLHQVNKQQ